MLRTLTSRRWLIWLLVATVWAVLCIFLGRWQWGRWEEKSVIQDRVDANYNSAPADIRELTGVKQPIRKQDEWRQVKMSGHYEPTTLMVRNRPGPDGDYGYQTVNVFVSNGLRVVVDRGWVPNGTTAKAPQSVPAAPKGDLTVIGWVRPTEKSLGRSEVPGQLASIAVSDVERVTGKPVAASYVRMRSEKLANGAVPPRPAALDRPSQGQAAGINLSYALQWWLGAIAGYAFVLLRARREYLDEQLLANEDAEPGRSAAQADDAGPQHPADVRTTKRTTKRPKKQRIWDEEDE